MKLEINVDETMFKDVLEKELEAFSKEELHDILKGCIIEFFKSNDNIKKMFLTEEYNTWGYGDNARKEFKGYKPTGLLNDIVRDNFDFKEPYNEVKDILISYCKKEDTLKNIMKEMITDSFQTAFTNCFWNDSKLRGTIGDIVRQEIFNLKSTNQI